jgi:hypothetical protein
MTDSLPGLISFTSARSRVVVLSGPSTTMSFEVSWPWRMTPEIVSPDLRSMMKLG